ncbi:uncharacterized protein LOC111715610, partial [Eurytemora carolleeae]|uniref:uncharacterized protein LOC111715610 n=1 Tax=Eurytemora carolleeae TaxID=1294199 RepID=UPI000C782A44
MWLIWVLILVLRFAGGGREATALLDPCRKYSCEAVSTKLMTHQEFKHFDLREKKRNPSWKKGASNSKWRTEKLTGNDLSWTRILKSKKFRDLAKYRNSTKSVQERRGSSNSSNLERKEINKRRLSRTLHRIKRMTRKHARTVLKLDTAVKRRKTKGCNKYAIFKVFGSDFQLCLVLGLFLDDSILRSDLRVSIYGNGSEYRTRKLSSMYLQLAEGHLIGQVNYTSLYLQLAEGHLIGQ